MLLLFFRTGTIVSLNRVRRIHTGTVASCLVLFPLLFSPAHFDGLSAGSNLCHIILQRAGKNKSSSEVCTLVILFYLEAAAGLACPLPAGELIPTCCVCANYVKPESSSSDSVSVDKDETAVRASGGGKSEHVEALICGNCPRGTPGEEQEARHVWF